jgi:hypothetical protein
MTRMKTIQQMWGIPPTKEAISAFIKSPKVSAVDVVDRTGEEPVVLYLNQGRWLADCRFCNGGMPGHPDGKIIGCPDCGSLYKVDTPTKKEVQEAEAVLMKRDHDIKLSWDRQKGQEVQDLKVENVTRGFEF